jgi:PAS domain S-box-containing protein
MYVDLEKQLNFFKTLDGIGKILNSTLELNTVLDHIVTELAQVLNLKGCTIRLLDPVKGNLELVAASGLSQNYLSRGSIDEELSSLQALEGQAVVMQDVASDDRISYQEEAKREGIASILAVPIKVMNRIIGVLRLLTSEIRNFSEAEVNFAMAVAEQGGIAIQNATNYEKINKLVIELEHNEDFLQNIMDRLNADLVVLDKDYRIVMANRLFLENNGLDDLEISGKPYADIMKGIDEDDTGEPSGGLSKEPDIKVKKVSDGDEEHYLEIMTSPVSIYSSEGEVDFIIKTIRDVTAHVQLRKEQKMRERMQGIIEIAGTIAHEFNTPLFVALGTTQLLMENIEQGDPMLDDVKTITDNLKKMSELAKKMSQITSYEPTGYYGDINIIDIHKASKNGEKPQE